MGLADSVHLEDLVHLKDLAGLEDIVVAGDRHVLQTRGMTVQRPAASGIPD